MCKMEFKRVRGWTSERSLKVYSFVEYPIGQKFLSPEQCIKCLSRFKLAKEFVSKN